MARKVTKRALLDQLLQELQPAVVDDAFLDRLVSELAPISDSYLRSLLRESGYPLAPHIEGVHATDLHSAERVLRALSSDYTDGDAATRKRCRAVVLESKARLRWSLEKSSENAQSRVELLLWVSTWLENPSLFPDWIAVRRRIAPIEDRTNPL